jgi:hypothetical protein
MVGLLALATLASACPSSCKSLKPAALTTIPEKLDLESCEDTRRSPGRILWDDVRWVDCDRPSPGGGGRGTDHVRGARLMLGTGRGP